MLASTAPLILYRLLDAADLDRLQPADFRLAAGSAGKVAAGRDAGAATDLVATSDEHYSEQWAVGSFENVLDQCAIPRFEDVQGQHLTR